MSCIVLLATLSGGQPVAASSIFWTATWDSGSWKPDFNGPPIIKCGAVDTVSTSIIHSGKYAGFDYYTGGPTTMSCRAHPTEQLAENLANFKLQIWVYVPSVQLKDWVSFITLHLSDDTFITIDSNTQRELHIWDQALPSEGQSIHQTIPWPIQWPFDKWFEITVVGNLNPGTQSSHLVVYQDNSKIIDFTGYTGDGLLWRMHFGLYIGAKQGAFAVYNADIQLWQTS